jgi:hypothetical protein
MIVGNLLRIKIYFQCICKYATEKEIVSIYFPLDVYIHQTKGVIDFITLRYTAHENFIAMTSSKEIL